MRCSVVKNSGSLHVFAQHYLLHAGELLLTVQSGGWWYLQAPEWVQSQSVQEQVLRWAFQPGGGSLLLKHGLRVGVRACGKGGDGRRCPKGVWRPRDGILRGKHCSLAVYDVSAFTLLCAELSLQLHKDKPSKYHKISIRSQQFVLC